MQWPNLRRWQKPTVIVIVSLTHLFPCQSGAGNSASQRIVITVKPYNELLMQTKKYIHRAAQTVTESSTGEQPLAETESSFRIYSNSANNKKILGEMLFKSEVPVTDLRLHVSTEGGINGAKTHNIFSANNRGIALDLLGNASGSGAAQPIRFSAYVNNCEGNEVRSSCIKPHSATVRLTLIDE